MSALAAFLRVGAIAMLGILARIGLDFRAHHRRRRRMAAEAICSDGQRHTGAEAAASGGASPGSGVVAASAEETRRAADEPAERDPRRCVRCHHFHLDLGSLICGGCREVMSHTKRTNGGAA